MMAFILFLFDVAAVVVLAIGALLIALGLSELLLSREDPTLEMRGISVLDLISEGRSIDAS